MVGRPGERDESLVATEFRGEDEINGRSCEKRGGVGAGCALQNSQIDTFRERGLE